jgi:hypothetical protein
LSFEYHVRGVRDTAVWRIGVRDKTQMSLSVPVGFVDSVYRQPFAPTGAAAVLDIPGEEFHR